MGGRVEWLRFLYKGIGRDCCRGRGVHRGFGKDFMSCVVVPNADLSPGLGVGE